MNLACWILLSLLLWGSLALLVHSYGLYPLMMRFLARGRELPGERFEEDEAFPEVVVLMAVYNEEAVLEQTLCSILASDYPRGRLRILVGSDGSRDRSDAILTRLAAGDERLQWVPFPGRQGKIRVINQLAGQARASLVHPESALFVLCDANVSWTPQLLRRLASHFRRASVGMVGAAVRDRIREHEGIGDQEEAYVGQENLVKFAEGLLWGRVAGLFGACYAMRARLFQPVPEHYRVDDFFQTYACFVQGAEAIVDLEAVCHEAVSTDIREEFRRKRRIASGNFQNWRHFWSFLLPWNGGWATCFSFWSHKGLRWAGPFLLITAFASSLVLGFLHPGHWLVSGAFVLGLLLSGLDAGLARRGGKSVKLLRFARYFLSMNAALFMGFTDFLRGPRNSVWEPTRREGLATAPSNAGEGKPALPR